MTAKERKPFRIACRRLLDCCNRQQIQKTEKLHLHGISSLDDIFNTLVTSERSVMNLKLSNHQFIALDNWSCGQKIEQLELENCAITLSSMEAILVSCTKLSMLALRNVRILCGRSPNYFDKTFIRVNQRKIVAPSVKTFIFNIPEILTLTGLSSLASIFPNIINLELNFHPSKQDRILSLQIIRIGVCNTGKNILSCEKFMQCLATNLLQLENLTVHTLSERCQCDKSIQETDFPRLKTVRFYNDQEISRVEDYEIYFPRVYTFITSSRSKDLTSIEFFADADAKDIINVLQELTGLLEIKVTLLSVRDFCEFTELYKALANSKLVRLKIQNLLEPEWISSLTQMLHDSSLPANSTVRELKISNEREEDVFISVFLKCFSALTHLRLTIMHKKSNFANIFHQTNLKYIKLKSSSPFGYHGCTLNPERSITSDIFVENLEYLSIEVDILKELSTRQPSIFFPNLRYLHFSSLGSLAMFSDQLPLTQRETRCIQPYNLEGVYMNIDYCVNDIFTFFSKPFDFPKIRYIGIKIRDSYVSVNPDVAVIKKWFESWFEYCPCLRAIFVEYKGTGMCLCYDPIQGEIREYQPEERTGVSLVDSLTGITMFNYYQNLKSFYDSWMKRS